MIGGKGAWGRIAFGLLLIVSLLGSGAALGQEASYPAWFRQMPVGEPLWAVGYARGYSSLKAGMEEAKTDAYQRLRRGRRVTIKGEKLYERAPGFRTSFEGARFTETGLPDTLRSVTYVDSLRAGGMTLVLAAWTPGRAPPKGTVPKGTVPKGRAPFSETPPSWVRGQVEEKSPAARAVGQAPRYFYLEHSWRRAEKRARRRLAFQASAKVKRLEKKTEDWRHGVTAIKTKVRLRDVQTLARWAGEDACYVLVEGTVEEVMLGR